MEGAHEPKTLQEAIVFCRSDQLPGVLGGAALAEWRYLPEVRKR
jgi:hypothetical protein